MKLKAIKGLFLIAAILFFSCTKEQASVSTGAAAQSSDRLFTEADASESTIANSIYTLYYDWFCTGHYSSTSMTVNADGTWSNGQGFTGSWVRGKGLFIFIFDGSKTVYSGYIRNGAVPCGIMTTFTLSNRQGCFYLEKSEKSKTVEKHIDGAPDSRGIR